VIEREAALPAAEPAREAVDKVAQAWRRERRLLAADDLAAWLERRGVTTESWLAYLRRAVARSAALADPFAAVDADAVWAEAMCSGKLDECAKRLARMLAVAPDADLGSLEAAYEAFCDEVATDEAITREIAAARLDWIRVRCLLAVFGERPVAAEVALLVRQDGLAFAEAAAAANTTTVQLEIWLEDADPALAPLLAGAGRNQLVGPVATAGGFVIVEVHEKLPADPADPTVMARAVTAAADRAADRAETDHVVWHEQL
jgi:hypothetical protein